MNPLFFGLFILLRPRLWALALKGVYLPVFVQYMWLAKFNIRTVIDVGAYRGDVSKALRVLFPEASMYAFEPVEENYETSRRNLSNSNVHLSRLALDQKPGRSKLYVHTNRALSSLLPSTDSPLDRTTQTPVTTLDRFFGGRKLRGDVFLKIDTQGNEDRILKGGSKILPHVSIVHIEISFERFYQSQVLFEDMYKLLTRFGFRFVGQAHEAHFYPLFHLEPQVNCVFVKKKFRFFKT